MAAVAAHLLLLRRRHGRAEVAIVARLLALLRAARWKESQGGRVPDAARTVT